ncbi:MAG: 50S ribosomal protein L29 [Chloroflexi bacterium]|nr:50S ribosomal protein L29 [Chloroflexota bacterium]
MKPEELQALSPDEIEKKLQEARQSLFNLRLRVASRQLEDTSATAKARREVARLLTVKREKEKELKGR